MMPYGLKIKLAKRICIFEADSSYTRSCSARYLMIELIKNENKRESSDMLLK